jgi:hypothetical protein
MSDDLDEDDLVPSWTSGPEYHLISDLFSGTTFDLPPNFKSGVPMEMPVIRRLTPAEERKRRKALAGLLRSVEPPPPRNKWLLKSEQQNALLSYACRQLANRIDPDYRGPRKVVFEILRGNIRQTLQNFPIVHAVKDLCERKGLPVTKAIERVADDCGLSVERVRDLWYERAGRAGRSNRRAK